MASKVIELHTLIRFRFFFLLVAVFVLGFEASFTAPLYRSLSNINSAAFFLLDFLLLP